MTHGSSNSNHHPLPPRDDRETLSALFDGELPGDAVRFALKRLDHDADWRETCGRWQLIGDALRGEATSMAPAGFASGVMRVLAAEGQAIAVASPASVQAAGAASSPNGRRRWIGGAALAASVAMAAVLVVRPFSESSTTTPGGQVATSVTVPAATQASSAQPSATEASNSAAATPASPAISVASADVLPAAGKRRASRPSRPAVRTGRAPSIQTQANEPAAVVAAATPASTGSPFHPPADDIVTRPWPRAVLSDSTAAGALTVGFGSSSAAAPSLYPFEPRLQPDGQPARPQTAEPQR